MARAAGTGARRYCGICVRLRVGLGEDSTGLSPGVTLCYARVSSQKQKKTGDLARQVEELRLAFPSTEKLYQDVGSGLNFRRKGFQALLERVHAGGVAQVAVLHRDRLCRFGLPLVEWILEKTGAKLVVFSQAEDLAHGQPVSEQRELADDLLAVVNVFVASANGQRSAANRKRRLERRNACGQSEEEERESKGVDTENEAPQTTQTRKRQRKHNPKSSKSKNREACTDAVEPQETQGSSP